MGATCRSQRSSSSTAQDAALTTAAEITANSPMGVWMTKEVAWSQLEIGSLQAGIDRRTGLPGEASRALRQPVGTGTGRLNEAGRPGAQRRA
jgi:hypothetical protein